MYLGNPCSPRLKHQLCFLGFGPWNLNKLWLWLCQIVWWFRPKIQSSWKILSFISRTYCFHWKFTCCCLQNRSFTGKVQMNESKIKDFFFLNFSCSFLHSNYLFQLTFWFSIRCLEASSKNILFPKLLWPFTVQRNCELPPVICNTSFYQSLEQFFLKKGQNNFRSKIP